MNSPEESPRKIPPRSDEDLKQIAQDLHAGRIFSSLHCEPEKIREIFMLLAFGVFEGWTQEDRDDLGLIYEYMDQAGPFTVNGNPSFLSLKLLNRADTLKVLQYHDKIKEMISTL